MGAKKSVFSTVDHIGVVVSNMDKAIEYYQSLGIGQFEHYKLSYTERKQRGKPIEADQMKVRAAYVKIGPIHLELVEPVKGESVWMEHLKSKGEGVNHLCFLVDDVDKEAAELKKKGLEIIYESKYPNGGGAVYLNTDSIGGLLIELIERPPR